MTIVHHTRRSRPSGRRLQAALTDWDGPPINWGTHRNIEGALNPGESVRLASNKLLALLAMRDAGVPVPDVRLDVFAVHDLLMSGRAMIGRSTSHRGGSGLWPCVVPEQMVDAVDGGATHFLELIPATNEFRVHVMAGKVIKTSEKLGGEGWVRTKAHGWKFRVPTLSYEDRKPVRIAARKAVRALGLDFGAVDVLFSDGRAWVTEVNTAPSLMDLSSSTFDLYVRFFTELFFNPA